MLKRLNKAISNKGIRGLIKAIIFHIKMYFYNLFSFRYILKRILNYQMILDLQDQGISRQLMRNEIREPDHKFLIEKELKPGMIVLECGANIGYYTIMMSKILKNDGMIHAIEPSPYNYHMLNLNILLNGPENKVTTYHMGMSNRCGEELLYLSDFANCHTFYPIDHLSGTHSQESKNRTVRVKMTTVEQFIQKNGPVHFIRMDVEGYEVEILTGLIPRLDDPEFCPKILVETHRPRYNIQNHDIKSPLNKLFKSGYYVKYLVADHHLKKNSNKIYQQMGYTEKNIVQYFKFCDRAIYKNITNEHAVYFICDTDFVRGVLLERQV